MRLRSIKLQNYRRYKSVELELPDGMISIIGSNGSGKSTLLEAFAWALFGNQTEIVRTGKESVKRQGSAHTDPCLVRIEFDYEDTGYIVERTMKGKNLTMNAEMYAGDSLIARGTDEVSDALIKLFGMDHKSFFISVFARQMELNALTSQPKGDRKKLVLRLLDIESVDDAIRRIREDLRFSRTSIETASAELTAPDGSSAIEKLEADIVELAESEEELVSTRKSLESELKKMESVLGKLKKELASQELLSKERNALDSSIRALKKESGVLEAQRKELAGDLELLKSKEEEFKAQEPKARKLADDLASILEKKKETQKERESIRSGMSDLKANTRQLEKEIKEIESHVKEISEIGADSDCPTCRRRLGDTYEKLLSTFDGQIKERRKKIKDCDKQISELEIKNTDCEGLYGALEKRESSFRERMAKFENLKFEIEPASRMRKKLDELGARTSKSLKEIELLDKKLAGISFDEKTYNLSRKALDELNGELRRKDRALNEKNTELARKEEQRKARTANLERLRDIEIKHSEEREKVELLAALDKVMGDFRTHLISRIRPAMASISSELLGILTEGRYNEIILDEDYEISLRDAGEQHKLDRFSGGEKDLANLCLRLAISEIIATRHGTNSFDLIVLDEIFGSQDANRKRSLLSTLNGLSNRFKQIFLITHVEDVKELMGNVIQVSENPDGTSSAEVSQ
jgi:exonuclease SbcC